MENFKKYYKIANKHEDKNELQLAINNYKKALEYKNNNINCLNNLSKTYEKIGEYEKAIEYYEKIITVSKDIKIIVITLNEIGIIYNKLCNYTEAIKYFKRTIAYKNDIPEIYLNLGVCYVSLKQYKQAEVSLLLYLKLKTDDVIYKKLGDLYFYMKKYDKSIFFYEKITNINEDYHYMYNLSFSYLSKKMYKIGFELYENRLKFNSIDEQTKEKQRVEIDIPYWNGIDNCEHLLIIYEQGIGDNILYYRFIIQLSKLYPNLKITYFCRNSISHIFKEYENIKVLNDKFPLLNLTFNKFNYKAYIMSLPYLLKLDNIHANEEKYINIDDEKNIFWENKLQILKNEKKKLNVGFTYKGLLSKSHIEKIIPLTEFEMLADLEINLICLHKKSDISYDLTNIHFSDKIITFDIDKEEAFMDTISILKNIDILISIDTSIVHLAGALDVKTLLLLGYGSDWRWFSDNTKVWYNSVEIVRMTENKELKYILPEVKNIISNMLNDTKI